MRREWEKKWKKYLILSFRDNLLAQKHIILFQYLH